MKSIIKRTFADGSFLVKGVDFLFYDATFTPEEGLSVIVEFEGDVPRVYLDDEQFGWTALVMYSLLPILAILIVLISVLRYVYIKVEGLFDGL